MSEGKLLIKKDSGEYMPLGDVKEVDLSEMETIGKYESNAPCLDMSLLPVTVTLNADIDGCAFIRAMFGSLKKGKMMARRAAKRAARLKRKEFYIARCRTKARYYNDYCLANVPKRIELPSYKWNVPLVMIRSLDYAPLGMIRRLY